MCACLRRRRRGVAVAAFLLALGWCTTAFSQPEHPRPPGPLPGISVRGEGVVRAAPDVAYVTVAAESRSSNPREAQRKNAATMAAVVDSLKRFAIRREDIQTVQAALDAEYDYANNRRTLRGYLARNAVRVTVTELDKTGDVVDHAVTAGATDVQGIQFDLRDRAGAERDALRLAVEDARRKAEAAAAAAGRQVGPVIEIQEMGAERPMLLQPMEALAAPRAAAPTTPVSPGELEIRARVIVRLALQ